MAIKEEQWALTSLAADEQYNRLLAALEKEKTENDRLRKKIEEYELKLGSIREILEEN